MKPSSTDFVPAPPERKGIKQKIFYGWWLVVVFFGILFNTVGHGYYVFPVFIGPLQAEFGWTVTQISLGVMVFALVSVFSGPAIGAAVGRFGVRNTMLAATVLMSLTHLGYASMQKLWMLYVLMAFSGIAVVGATALPAQTAITNWFDKYRGRAMALVFVGVGAGGFVLPPFNEFLIRQWGWRPTWIFSFFVIWLFVIPLLFFFVRTNPAELGLKPDGLGASEANDSESKPAARSKGLSVGRAIASQTFWILVAIFVLQGTGLAALNFHFVPFAEQQGGFSSQNAAFYYGLAVGFSMIGRLLGGWLADHLKPQWVLAFAGVLMAAGPAALEVFVVRLGWEDARVLWLHAVPFGIGLGINVIVIPILVSRCFGELNFSKIMGLIGIGFAIAVAVGIPGAGYLFDTTGSYEIVIVFCVLGCLASSVLATLLKPDRLRSEFVTGEE